MVVVECGVFCGEDRRKVDYKRRKVDYKRRKEKEKEKERVQRTVD